MGIFWSTRHDYYIHEFENPHVQPMTKDIMLHLIPDQDGKLVCSDGTLNPFSDFVSDDDLSQRAVVLKVCLKSVKNEFTTLVNLCLNNMFDNSIVNIACPPSSAIVVQTNDQLLYQNAKLNASDTIRYAGLDGIMLDEQECDGDHEIFADDHPIVSHIKYTGQLHNQNVTRKEGNRVFYMITKSYVAEIREFLTKQVFENIHYTRLKDCTITCDDNVTGGSSLFVTLSVDYILINTGIPSLRQKTEQIK